MRLLSIIKIDNDWLIGWQTHKTAGSTQCIVWIMCICLLFVKEALNRAL